MVKNRLIFTLLLKNGTFVLSRNFKLQSVGDLDWIKKYYNFETIAFSIDELIVLNVERGKKNIIQFAENLLKLSKLCFAPIAAGGGIRTIEDARLILNSGADKLIVNTPLVTEQKFVINLKKTFGSQCVVASIDYKKLEGKTEVIIDNGSKNTGLTLEKAVKNAQVLGVGEIYITSIEKDGTGQGLDLDAIHKIGELSTVPIIASGGVGNYDHIAVGMEKGGVKAVSTANLFNFLGNGLAEARKHLLERNMNMAEWKVGWKKSNK